MRRFWTIIAVACVTGVSLVALAPPSMATPSAQPQRNPNWAGYLSQGSFTSTAGSFTVPSLTLVPILNDNCASYVTEVFVGVTNKAGVKLRAGIDMSGWDPALSSCFYACSPACVGPPEGAGHGGPLSLEWLWAWYSDSASGAQVTLPTVAVNEGDVVGVSLNELSTGTWEVGISDQPATLHLKAKHVEAAMTLQVPFTGPAANASWIVGTPYLTTPCGGQCQTAAYTSPWNPGGTPVDFPAPAVPGPAVNFATISTNGNVATPSIRYTQYAGSTVVAMPSQPFSATDGFEALYVTPGALGGHSACLGPTEPCLPTG